MGRWVHTVLLAIGLAGLLTVAAPGSAWACSCMSATFAEHLAAEYTDRVFTGTAVDHGSTEGMNSSETLVPWTFTVDAVQRGSVTRTTTVWTPIAEGSCGFAFTAGQRYAVLARLEPGGVAVATLCSGTVRLADLAASDLTVLGAGTPPAADTTAMAPRAAETSLAPALWAAAAAMVVLAVIVVIVVRRPRRE